MCRYLYQPLLGAGLLLAAPRLGLLGPELLRAQHHPGLRLLHLIHQHSNLSHLCHTCVTLVSHLCHTCVTLTCFCTRLYQSRRPSGFRSTSPAISPSEEGNTCRVIRIFSFSTMSNKISVIIRYSWSCKLLRSERTYFQRHGEIAAPVHQRHGLDVFHSELKISTFNIYVTVLPLRAAAKIFKLYIISNGPPSI